MTTRIAGHEFGLDDRCTLSKSVTVDGMYEDRPCPVRWLDIKDCDESCTGKEGYAHHGALNAEELDQIRKEKVRREILYEQATHGACGYEKNG